MPKPDKEGKDRFQLVPRAGEIDFLARETLDDLEFTPGKIRKNMPKDKRSCAKRREPGEDERPPRYPQRDYDDEDRPF